MVEQRYLTPLRAVMGIGLLSIGLWSAGCGGSGDDDDSSGTTTPTPSPEATATPEPEFQGKITITQPEDGAEVALDFDTLTAGFAYDVEGFTIKPEGDCTSATTCGRVEVHVDGDACNKDGASYNYLGSANPITAFFGYCSDALGTHDVTLKLVYDDGSDTGVSSTVTVITTLPSPGIAITNPNVTNSEFVLPDDGLVDVTVSHTNLVLAAPGTCGSTPNCGHIILKVDGDDGNLDGNDYNAIITADSEEGVGAATVDLNALPEATGIHEIAALLLHDDGTPYLGPNGNQIAALQEIQVAGPDDPRIEIYTIQGVDPESAESDPENPTRYTYNDDEYRSIAIGFDVTNFKLATDCSGEDPGTCGHVRVLVDANNEEHPDIGNQPGMPYNNMGTGILGDDNREIDAYMYWVSYNGGDVSGAHTVTLALFNDDGEQIVASDIAVQDDINITLQSNDEATNLVLNTRLDATVNYSDVTNQLVTFTVTVNDPMDSFFWGLADSIDPETSCQAAPSQNATCVHLRLFIDDDAGNLSGLDYNGISVDVTPTGVGTITADFSAIDQGDLYDVSHRVGVVIYDSLTEEPIYIDNGSTEMGDWTIVTVNDPNQADEG